MIPLGLRTARLAADASGLPDPLPMGAPGIRTPFCCDQVKPGRVHRMVYLDQDILNMKMQQIVEVLWICADHGPQIQESLPVDFGPDEGAPEHRHLLRWAGELDWQSRLLKEDIVI